jgi:hypothetical protein
MAEKKKSIIEEALLEAKSLEDALKANTKEMLAAHMKKSLNKKRWKWTILKLKGPMMKKKTLT